MSSSNQRVKGRTYPTYSTARKPPCPRKPCEQLSTPPKTAQNKSRPRHAYLRTGRIHHSQRHGEEKPPYTRKPYVHSTPPKTAQRQSRPTHGNPTYRCNTTPITAQRKNGLTHTSPNCDFPPHYTHNCTAKSQAAHATPTCERRLWRMAALSAFPMPAPPLTSSTVCLPSPRVARTRLEVVLASAPVPPGRCHAFLQQQPVH